MKTKITFLLAFFCMILLSCDKDQKLISEVAGEYKIEEIINYNAVDQPTKVNLTSGKIVFDGCVMDDVLGGNCTGFYEINGKLRVTIQYFTRKERGSRTIRISNAASSDFPAILGYYEFEKKGNVLLLNGVKGSSDTYNGVSFSNYSDMRFSKN